MTKNKLLDTSKDFAIDIINLCKSVKEQKRDFISKLHIALKECYESEYWLELLVRSNCIDEQTYKQISNKCSSIRKMLISSLNTAKGNN